MFRFDQPATPVHRISIDRRYGSMLPAEVEDFANDDAAAPRERVAAPSWPAARLPGLTVSKHGRGLRLVRPDGQVSMVAAANSNHDPSPVTPALAA